MLVVAAVVVLANSLYLSGLFDPNPLSTNWTGLVTTFKRGLLVGYPTIDPNNGVTSQTFGHLAMLDWLHLKPPWWNPYEGTGAPLAGETVSAALFPFSVFTLMANGQIYERLAFELVAGIATYLLLRRLALGRTASTAGAIAFALNGTYSWFSHAPINVIAFLPLLLLGIEIAFEASADGRSGGWWLIAVAGALSVYGGFPETTYIDTLLAVLWFLWRCGCTARPQLRAFVIKATVGGVTAVLLAAPSLVAFADYSAHAFTAHGPGAFANAHLPHAALPQFLLPYVYGPIFAFFDPNGTVSSIWAFVGGYLSVSLLLFGLLGLVSPGRRGLRAILLLWVVLAVARVYGEPPGLGHVVGVLPNVDQVLFQRYADPSVEMAVVVLAALGIDALRTRSVPWTRLVSVVLVALAAVVVATIGAASIVHQLGPGHQNYSRFSVIVAFTVLVIGALAMVLRSSRARLLVAASVVSLEALGLFVLPEFSARQSATRDTTPVAYLQRHLGPWRFATLGPLLPNYGSYYGLRSLNANDALLPSAFAGYVDGRLAPGSKPLSFSDTSKQELLSHLDAYRQASVRYVLTHPGVKLPLGTTKFQLVLRTRTAWIYRLSGASPYFTVTHHTCGVTAQSGQSARVSCSAATTLVRRETYMTGWSAQVDGKATPVHPYQAVFQAVRVGRGTHRVTFGYVPPGMTWALVGFALGCLCLIGVPLLLGRTRGPAQDGKATPAGAETLH